MAVGAATGFAVAAYALSLFGLSAKSNRQHRELVAAIEAITVAGVAARAGGLGAALDAARRELPEIVSACTASDGDGQ